MSVSVTKNSQIHSLFSLLRNTQRWKSVRSDSPNLADDFYLVTCSDRYSTCTSNVSLAYSAISNSWMDSAQFRILGWILRQSRIPNLPLTICPSTPLDISSGSANGYTAESGNFCHLPTDTPWCPSIFGCSLPPKCRVRSTFACKEGNCRQDACIRLPYRRHPDLLGETWS